MISIRPLLPSLSTSLLASLLALGCGDDVTDPADRYEPGPVAPCEVVYDGSHEVVDQAAVDVAVEEARAERADPFAQSPPAFWLPGPYFAWSTTPDGACGADPTIPRVGEPEAEDGMDDVKIYVTYPTDAPPTITGDGRVAEGRFPVVIFAHANSDRRCDIYQSYYSLHDHWASWGFVVVAIDGTETNCSPGTKRNIELRIAGILAGLERMRELNADPESRFHERLDLERVIFAGHSRGGGAAVIASFERPEALGVIDLQGVDVTGYGFGKAPITVPFMGLTAGKDVDLNYPYVEPTEDQLAGPYTWVNINGGIHAYTSTTAPIEPDDEPGITQAQQHDITELYTTAFLMSLIDAEAEAEPILYSHAGAEVVDEEIADAGVYVRWNEREEGALLIDDFDSPIEGDGADVNELGGDNVADGLDRSEEVPTYKPDTDTTSGVYGKAYSRLLVGTGSYTTYLAADRSAVPAEAMSRLQARLKGPDEGATAAPSITLVTEDDEATLSAADYLGPEALSNRFSQLDVPLAAFGVETAKIVAIRVEIDGGAVFVDDLRLTP